MPAEINNRRNDKVLVGAVGKERDKTIAQLIQSIQVQTGVPIGKYDNKCGLVVGIANSLFAHSNI